MKTLRLRRARNPVHCTRRYPVYAAIAVGVALVVALIAVSVAKKNITNAYEKGRVQLAQSIQTNINEALRAFDRITLPNADVQGDILPTMRTHLYAARTLNEAMVDTYGITSGVVDAEVFTQIETAIDEVERSIDSGLSIQTARDTLSRYITSMETALIERFEGSDQLRSRTALK